MPNSISAVYDPGPDGLVRLAVIVGAMPYPMPMRPGRAVPESFQPPGWTGAAQKMT